MRTRVPVVSPHAGESSGISALINCPGVSFSDTSVPAFVSVPGKATHGPLCRETLSARLWWWFILQNSANEILTSGFIFAILFPHSFALLHFSPSVCSVL